MTPTFAEAIKREETSRLANECWERNRGFVLEEVTEKEEEDKTQINSYDFCYD